MGSMACVGALSLDGKTSYRLMSKPGSNWPQDTPFGVGQIWDIDIKPIAGQKPPHVEDVHVVAMRNTGARATLTTLIQRSPLLWPGPLAKTFGGMLQVSSA